MHALWVELLGKAMACPYDSPAWTNEDIAAFADTLTSLANEKKAAGKAALVDEHRLLVELRAIETEWRTYFGYFEPAQWSARDLATSEAAEVRARLEPWLQALKKHRDVRSKPITDIAVAREFERLRHTIQSDYNVIHELMTRLPLADSGRFTVEDRTAENNPSPNSNSSIEVENTTAVAELPVVGLQDLQPVIAIAEPPTPPTESVAVEPQGEASEGAANVEQELQQPQELAVVERPIAVEQQIEAQESEEPHKAPEPTEVVTPTATTVIPSRIEAPCPPVATQRVDDQPLDLVQPPTEEMIPLSEARAPGSPISPERPGLTAPFSIRRPSGTSLLRQAIVDVPAVRTQAEADEALWTYLGQGDAAAAYWIDQELKSRGKYVFDERLLELAHAAIQPLAGNDTSLITDCANDVERRRWEEVEYERTTLELSTEAERQDEEDRQDAVRCVRIAAMLQPQLFSVSPFTREQLPPPISMPWLADLVNSIVELANRIAPVTPTVWHDIVTYRRLHRAMEAWEGNLRSTYINRETRCQPCLLLPNLTPVIEHLIGPGKALRQIADAVLKDQWDQSPRIRPLTAAWRNEKEVSELTWSVTKELYKNIPIGWKKLHAHILRDLTACIEGGCGVTDEWFEWVDSQREADAAGYRSRLEGTAKAVRQIDAFVKEVSNLVERLTNLGAPAQRRARAAAKFLAVALGSLRHTLTALQEPDLAISVDPHQLTAARLWCYPTLAFDGRGRLREGQGDWILALLDGSPVSTAQYQSAFDRHLEAHDIDAAGRLLPLVPAERRSAAKAALSQVSEDLTRETLEAVNEVRQAIDRQRADGWLTETRYAVYNDYLADIIAGRLSETEAAEYVSIVADEIEKNHASTQSHAVAGLASLRQRLRQANVSAAIKAEALERLDAIERAGVAREASEITAQLHNALDAGLDVEARIAAIVDTTRKSQSDDFDEFVKQSGRLSTLLRNSGAGLQTVLHHMKEGYPPAELRMRKDAVPQVTDDLEAWAALRSAGDDKSAAPRVARVLQFLGFGRAKDVGVPTPVGDMTGRILRFTAARSAPSCPLPEFGSKANEQYRIIVVTAPAGVDAVAQELASDEGSRIVFYCGALSIDHRHELAARLLKVDGAALIVDDILMLHLASKPSHARNASLFTCTIPFGSLNPYAEAISDPVPKEMFFGRQKMLQQIRGSNKNMLLYGGRQLGKSALLMRIYEGERDSDVIAIHHIIDSDRADTIWAKLDSTLRKAKFIQETEAATGLNTVETRICAAAKRDPRKVLLLLDEADAFVREELLTGSENLNAIRRIHSLTGARFRVILVGNYSLQRYAHLLGNNAGELYENLVVGPLDYPDAVDLIVKPLEMLGYTFRQDDQARAVLRVIDYTFCQAGLLQLFLHHLVEKLRARRPGRGALPAVIRPEDIDAVAQVDDQRLLKEVRERFQLTLRLDVEYELILAVLLAEPEGVDSYLSVDEIRQRLDTYWPSGIDTLMKRVDGSVQRLEETWLRPRLAEMVGLGVLLARSGVDGDRYATRTASLRRLFSKEGVHVLLSRLSREAPTEDKRIESWHARLDEAGRRFALFNSADESRALNQCVIVAGAPIAGSDRLPVELARMCNRRDIKEVLHVPTSVQHPEQLSDWLKATLLPRGRQEGLYVLYDVPASGPASLGAFDKAVGDFFKAVDRRATVWLRIDPEALHASVRQQPLMAGADAMSNLGGTARIVLRPWEPEAIRARLYEQRREPTRDEVGALMALTGGWPMLLDTLDSMVPKDARRSDFEAMWKGRLADQDFASTILAATSLRPSSTLYSVLDKVVETGGLFMEEAAEWLRSHGFGEHEGHAALASLRALHYVRVEVVDEDVQLVAPDAILAHLWKARAGGKLIQA